MPRSIVAPRAARTAAAAAALALVVVTMLVPGVAAAADEPAANVVPQHREKIGVTAAGRAIYVTVRGRSDAAVDVVVVGVIHGNERAGLPIVQRLLGAGVPRSVRYWLLPALNIDGQRRNTRQNARGVDLNRNFPYLWRGGGRPFDVYYPGRSRASEPETRAYMRLVQRVHPDATIWYHQHARMVIRPDGRWRQALARVYERASGLAMRRYPVTGLRGTASTWQQAEQRRALALVVELPAGRLSRAAVGRHADAVRRLALAAWRDDVRSP
ncbi:MAG: succinylglutamate desuccinylase/aspartoacylase family protein [Thermoleophilia bacterium]|nr:succinylglutamate desuccinylase/aspartoacylase family protein [Thermoleophilia bacterium]